jgi:hypothetical protein
MIRKLRGNLAHGARGLFVNVEKSIKTPSFKYGRNPF